MKDFKTENIRNVILLSHTGAGKTSITEAMLYDAKVVTRMGKVDEGNTVSDFEPEEVKRRSSISTSLAPLEWKSRKVNVIDPPGYFDFVGEVKSSLRVADGGVIVVCAASGVEVGTELSWGYAEQINLPRILFVNKIDRENADFIKVVDEITEKLGRKCVPIQLAIGSQDTYAGAYDLIAMKPLGDAKADALPQDQIDAFREKLVEGVAEADDDLAEKYLEGEEITDDEIRKALNTGTRENKIVPIVVGSALKDKNIGDLLDAICEYLPSPKDRGAVEGKEPEEGASMSALVFKTSTDPYVGKMNFLRVFSGTLNSDSSVLNVTKGKTEKVAQLFTMRGKTQETTSMIVAGDIGMVAKLAETSTGDTLAAAGQKDSFSPIDYPVPNLSVAVYPKTKADFDKLGTVLAKLSEEDPSTTLKRDPDTGETILSGYGEAQLEVIADKMKRKFNLDVELTTPRIPYKETITTSANAEYKHKKQTGGHGQYGHVLIELEPLPKNSGYEFAEKIVGGAIPKNYIPAVAKGINEGLSEGVLAGCPLVDLKVTLYDGSFHNVDSSDMAFKIAARSALKKGVESANPVLLEPIVNVKITIPDSYTGDVMGDLNGRRARISGMNPENGISVIEATAPLSEMQRYSIDLRSMTQGRGTYVMEVSTYEEVPAHIMQKIIDEVAAAKE